MAKPENRSEPSARRVILDVEGAREVGPTEAAGLVRECLGIFYRRLDTACWRALEQMAMGSDADAAAVAKVLTRERGKFFSRFRSEFEQIFANRQTGKPRARLTRTESPDALALVEENDLKEQVSLKGAVQGMRNAVREEGFGFDLRARIVMREPAKEGEYDNPFGADYVVDALGNACRHLFAAGGAWRPVMEHLVRTLTPEIVGIHREINDLLLDRDILPVLRVRTRKRAASSESEETTLYQKVMERVAGGAQQAAPHSAPAGSDPLDFGNPAAWHLPTTATTAAASSALAHALALLANDVGSSVNALPQLAATLAGEGAPARDRAAIEILAAVMDEVFDSAHLPDAIKTVFGRLQIPMLKAALSDPTVFVDKRHRMRYFFDTLAAASVGLRPDDAHDALFIALADHLAEVIRDDVASDRSAFDSACEALAEFLDSERAAYNVKLTEAIPPLIALDEYAAARSRVQAVIAMRLAGKSMPAELRAYFEDDGLDRLTAAYVADGEQGQAWRAALADVDDLLWSIAPEPGPEARKRLVLLVPVIVRKFGNGWPTSPNAKARRKVFLATLYALHMEAMKPQLPLLPSDEAEAEPAPTPSPTYVELEPVDDPETLLRGDWCVFDGENGASLLAKFAWRAPHGTQLLFTHRDGSMAVTHTPQSFARCALEGRARVVVEAAPLFERAMERLIERR